MVTDYGSLKVSAKLDENMQKEYNSVASRLTLAMIIVGSVCTAAFLVLFVISEFVFSDADGFYFMAMLIASAVVLGGGIGLKILINKSMRAIRGINKVIEYEFFKNYFTLNEIVNGDKVGTAKIYNGQVVRVRETKNYIFLYLNAAVVYPVTKSELNEAELLTLKNLFRPSSGVSPLALSDNISAPRPSEPEDPFSEFK